MMNTMNTMYAIGQVTTAPIGKIEYLNARGEVVDYTYYDDIATMVQDVKDELEWDVAIAVKLFGDTNGYNEHESLFEDVVDLLHGFEVVDAPKHVVL